ncbi:hypothetical protein OU994_12205 [Pseudoduganella sp. SL102]|uniref:Uncharacterized protein n=1 Tax=Pseudoduganella albidiflava TaxID=321983 RepID=A0A411X102_9BURK|nr:MULTISPECIES: hypothetical protein [Pseudoduganella]QBI02545.1 hypothetical protein EYF70_18130 [Pseudoduganella albidiflava]WBS04981.1 hypothetical protein OU994_12205 [Pseudoduganella sp. SL102]GGY41924.1 hypothetical protein GCM10007387_24830 [Pseudoduganella albidiflava]
MSAMQKNDQQNKQSADDSEKGGHMMNEPDIGSGEKSPGEKETDEQIRQIPQRTPEPPKAG